MPAGFTTIRFRVTEEENADRLVMGRRSRIRGIY
jgi:hypothetical protein